MRTPCHALCTHAFLASFSLTRCILLLFSPLSLTVPVSLSGNRIADGFDLQEGYYKFSLPVIEEQIAKGGIRMAHVLNSIFAESKFERFVVSPEEFQQNKEKEKEERDTRRTPKIVLAE